MAQRIVRAVAELGRRYADAPVTASVGLAMANPADDVRTLIRNADAQAYAAKRAGGNRVALARPIELESSGVQPKAQWPDDAPPRTHLAP